MLAKVIAEIFRNIARILEIKGENVFRIRAYERAAQNIESLNDDIQDMINENRLSGIPGIGQDLSAKIIEIARTGKLQFLEELKKTIPEGLLDLLNVPSIGPKHAKLFYEKLRIKSIPELEKAAGKGELSGLKGIKEKAVENILKGIELLEKGRQRMDLASAIRASDEFIQPLKNLPCVKKITACGSLRRMKETVRDIDILAASDSPDKVMDAFVRLPSVKDITVQGRTKSSVITREGVQLDLRVVEEKSYGAALLYFTGSKNFNIKIRQLAMKKNLKINEYGVFSATKSATIHGGLANYCGERGGSANNYGGKKERFICGRTEEEIFKCLGLDYIEPELREDRNEIELSSRHRLPLLISLKDIKGDLHTHSEYSDGQHSIAQMAEAARGLGYEYLNISDHSQGLKVAGGLSIGGLKKKRIEIDRLNSKFKNFKLLFGSEVDIDSSGRLDYPDPVLAGFDVTVAAIHSGFKQSKSQLTKRLVNACKNKNVDIIAHPSGRLWGSREPYELDFEEVFKAASDYGTALEINGYALRLDLNDINSSKAKEKGVRLAATTDAHALNQLKYMHLAVAVARRGSLTKDDVINTLPYEELMKVFKK